MNSFNLGDFNKLSLDSVNHILTFLDSNDIKQINQINLNFHTVIQTTSVSRKFMDETCDKFISQIAVMLPHISPSEPDTLDTIYSVIMKKPMMNAQILDKTIIKCQLFLHQTYLQILNQIEIFAKHYKDDKDLRDILLSKFIKECVCRLIIMDATFNCINSLLEKTDETCHKMIENMDSARNDIEQQTTDQQSILMRLATNVSRNWDLFDLSQDILRKHLALTNELKMNHEKVTKQLYEVFLESRVQTVVNVHKFDFRKFTKSIQNILH